MANYEELDHLLLNPSRAPVRGPSIADRSRVERRNRSSQTLKQRIMSGRFFIILLSTEARAFGTLGVRMKAGTFLVGPRRLPWYKVVWFDLVPIWNLCVVSEVSRPVDRSGVPVH